MGLGQHAQLCCAVQPAPSEPERGMLCVVWCYSGRAGRGVVCGCGADTKGYTRSSTVGQVVQTGHCSW